MLKWVRYMNILSLGEKIKKLRKEKNMTLKELAGDRITAAQISHIERDKSHTSYELLEYLSERLDVSIDYLLIDSANKSDNFLEQMDSVARSLNPSADNSFRKTVKILAEHIDEM